ncbi:FAD binding monooxygenase [Phyllosticta capitalensis]|uniref:FAD binding monooxygenase n=1 Tax=Phyllosticta capitalensis TaxID=121624 RepID=A0ABR1YJ59_9PEZI
MPAMDSTQEKQRAADTQVLIVGGGLGGLMLAAILRRINISCKVLERTAELTPAGAGISLAPNALRVLDQMGLYGAIQKHGQKLRSIKIHHNTTFWRELDFDMEPWFKYPVYSIERHLFHHMLYEAAGGDETVVLDAKVVDVLDAPKDEVVRARLEDGREFTGDMLVAADGIRSVVRRILARNSGMENAANTIRFTGRVHMSGYTQPLEHLSQSDLGVGNWLFFDDSVLTTWPCVENRQWYIGVKVVDPSSVRSDRSVWENTTLDTINDVYGKKFHPFAEHGRFEEIVNKSERFVASNVFSELSFPTMSSGRVALLGDAAHSMTSFFGQGACQAIEDATILANMLHRHYSPSSSSSKNIPDVLKSYAREREDRAKAVADFSASYAKVHTANLPLGFGPFIRKLIYGYAPAWVWMWYLKWLYGYQPSVDALGRDKKMQ